MSVRIYRFRLWFVLLVSFGMVGNATHAGAEQGGVSYAVSDIVGTYAVCGIGQGGFAPGGFVGVANFKSNNVFSAFIKEFIPGENFDERAVVESQLTGVFDVEEDPLMRGRAGTITLDSEEQLPFIVTKGEGSDNSRKATEIVLTREFVDADTGNLTSVMLTRRDERVAFDTRSLHGTYAFRLTGEEGTAPTTAVGIVQYDGDGNGCSRGTSNIPGTLFGERIFFDFGPFFEAYTVNKDGTGVICFPNPAGVSAESFSQGETGNSFCSDDQIENVFVITKSRVVDIGGNQANLALELRWSNRQLDPFTGGFVSGMDNRISDDVDLSPCDLP
jgi:hypothetical protein